MQSPKGILAVALLVLGASARAQSTAPMREALTNRAIVTLAAAGFNEDFIVELILNGRTQFDTSVEGLASLRKQGINQRVIRAMLNLPGGDGEPKPAMANHTPYYRSTSIFWGLIQTRIGVGAAPENQPTHLGMLYVPLAAR